MRTSALLLSILLLAACASQSPYLDDRRTTTRKSATSAQGLVGVSFLDDDLEFTETAPGGETATADLSNMPTLGFGGHYRMFGQEGGLEGGLDGTLLFSWWRDSAEVRAAGGGAVLVSVSTRMFIADIGFGLYVSKKFNQKWRLYGAIGPLVQFSDAKFEDSSTSSTESGFGVGGYVRGGVEFAFERNSWLGLGVRGTTSEIDFGAQDISTDALQVFVTITQDF